MVFCYGGDRHQYSDNDNSSSTGSGQRVFKIRSYAHSGRRRGKHHRPCQSRVCHRFRRFALASLALAGFQCGGCGNNNGRIDCSIGHIRVTPQDTRDALICAS